MATGDVPDVQARINALLPTGWFTRGLTPLKDALVAGMAYLGSYVYSLIIYLLLQTRIATATDGFLDIISLDFFGPNGLPRAAGQSDTSYRASIQANLFRPRNTRSAINEILEQLTGITPIIFEPWRPADTGGYGLPVSGYGVAGGYGSMSDPGQAFITAFRAPGAGVPFVAGYGIPVGAYSTPSLIEYASLEMISGSITDADIYAAVNSVRPATRILWVKILNAPPSLTAAQIATQVGVVIDTESGVPLST